MATVWRLSRSGAASVRGNKRDSCNSIGPDLVVAFASAKFKLILWPLTGNQQVVATDGNRQLATWQHGNLQCRQEPKSRDSSECNFLATTFASVVLVLLPRVLGAHYVVARFVLAMPLDFQVLPPLFSSPLPNYLCVSFNAIYYLKLNIHRTLEQNFVHRLNFLTVASDAVNRKKVGKYRKGMGVVRGWGGCLQDTTRTGLKIATPNWVFKFSNIISRQIDKFSFAPSLCANFSASNWVISLQSSIEIYYIYYIQDIYVYVSVCLKFLVRCCFDFYCLLIDCKSNYFKQFAAFNFV